MFFVCACAYGAVRVTISKFQLSRAVFTKNYTNCTVFTPKKGVLLKLCLYYFQKIKVRKGNKRKISKIF